MKVKDTVKCISCSEIISIRADECPYCGRSQGKKKSKGRWGRIIGTIIVVTIMVVACVAVSVFLLDDRGKFGTDYWFEELPDGGEVLKTSDGWTFQLNVRQEYTLQGVILGTKYYYKHDSPYSPINTFSPIDIFVGVDNVAQNMSSYDYEITSWENRELTWYIYYDNYDHYEYFRTHTGNNHLIPHNEEVFHKFLDLEKGDKFSLSGFIVEPDGSRASTWVTWPSDNQIGNYACEVILVDTLVIQ